MLILVIDVDVAFLAAYPVWNIGTKNTAAATSAATTTRTGETVFMTTHLDRLSDFGAPL